MGDSRLILGFTILGSILCLSSLVWVLEPGGFLAIARFVLAVAALVLVDVGSFMLYRQVQKLSGGAPQSRPGHV